ncbi:MAG: hypothetical protein EOO38_18700 [Cytophagaceae bacterium]|nr:MAG: hypothetical protein EOO38_18700 [Cytophagaceae bacterium]
MDRVNPHRADGPNVSGEATIGSPNSAVSERRNPIGKRVVESRDPAEASQFNQDQYASGEGIHQSDTGSRAKLTIQLPGQKNGVSLTRPTNGPARAAIEAVSAQSFRLSQTSVEGRPSVQLPSKDERVIQATLRSAPTAPPVRATTVDLPFEHNLQVFGKARVYFPSRLVPREPVPAAVEPQSAFPLDETGPVGTPSVRMPVTRTGLAAIVREADGVASEVQLVWSTLRKQTGHFKKHAHEFAELGISNVNDYHTLAQKFFAQPLGASLEEFINVDNCRIYRWDSSIGLLGCLELPTRAETGPPRLASLFRPKFSVRLSERKEAAANYVNMLRP